MNSDGALGKDRTPAEVYKAAGPEVIADFHDILLCIWQQEKIPDDFCNVLIVTLWKKKGNKAAYENCRGISLLSVTGRIFAWAILNRLITVSEAILPEAECRFHPGQCTINIIFSVRRVQEKCLEQKLDLYAMFIKLTKALDTVNREVLWYILAWCGCPLKFIQIIRLFDNGRRDK